MSIIVISSWDYFVFILTSPLGHWLLLWSGLCIPGEASFSINTLIVNFCITREVSFSIRTKPRWKGLFANCIAPKKKEMKQQVLKLPLVWQGKQRKKTGEKTYPITMEIFGNYLTVSLTRNKQRPHSTSRLKATECRNLAGDVATRKNVDKLVWDTTKIEIESMQLMENGYTNLICQWQERQCHTGGEGHDWGRKTKEHVMLISWGSWERKGTTWKNILKRKLIHIHRFRISKTKYDIRF